MSLVENRFNAPWAVVWKRRIVMRAQRFVPYFTSLRTTFASPTLLYRTLAAIFAKLEGRARRPPRGVVRETDTRAVRASRAARRSEVRRGRGRMPASRQR